MNMKKKLIILFLVIQLLNGVNYYINLPDYHVLSSMSFNTPGTRDTELKVLVYKYWKSDEIIRDIEDKHNSINGTPTTLKIDLYYSKWDICHGKAPFKTALFDYR